MGTQKQAQENQQQQLQNMPEKRRKKSGFNNTNILNKFELHCVASHCGTAEVVTKKH